MNKNYVKGSNWERKIVKLLEEKGFYAARTAGSHTSADVIGIKNGLVKLIQAKTSRKKDLEIVAKSVLDKEFDSEFINKVFGNNVDLEIWVKGPGKNNVLVVDVL